MTFRWYILCWCVRSGCFNDQAVDGSTPSIQQVTHAEGGCSALKLSGMETVSRYSLTLKMTLYSLHRGCSNYTFHIAKSVCLCW